MRIIFLDVDGCLTNREFLLSNKNNIYNSNYSIQDVCDTQVAPENVKRLNDILDDDVYVVLCSSWRKFVTLEELTKGLIKNGLKKDFSNRFIDKTPITGQRDEEINLWLKNCKEKIDSYIILDDSRDKYDNLKLFKKHWIKINSQKGLTGKKAKKAIKRLNTLDGKLMEKIINPQKETVGSIIS